eukprot:CAMPEP_0119271978 /NCGR_PEP_ID=MMETSP1329-20130426/8351_1 /TAXON_ID=114041 /ORGANISM="Genus nov. species nov., Strain RCC1024" /LENGTH=126 /DNA_ID=CAMNT_0007272035 /DNA_START=44 /DNA_END=421 /DNA_ORIENTATION=+
MKRAGSAFVGRRVAKRFVADSGHERLFRGEVVAYDEAEGWWRVLYDDGDGEELDEAGLLPILSLRRPRSYVGRRVEKRFLAEDGSGYRPFGGEVESYDEETGWFKITYDDGDGEELDEEALVPLLT